MCIQKIKMSKLNKYSKEEIDKAVLESNCIAAVCRNIGIGTRGNNFERIKKYIDFYNSNTDHFQSASEQLKGLAVGRTIPLEKILIVNSTYGNSYTLKKRLLKEAIKINKCEVCGLSDKWNDKNINMQLDHINGVNNDNRIENLRMICPNCHSQTETFCGKHNGQKAIKDKEREKMEV